MIKEGRNHDRDHNESNGQGVVDLCFRTGGLFWRHDWEGKGVQSNSMDAMGRSLKYGCVHGEMNVVGMKASKVIEIRKILDVF